MQKAIWKQQHVVKPVPCWLHSVEYGGDFGYQQRACIAFGDGPELELKWVPMSEVRIVRRLAASLEEN